MRITRANRQRSRLTRLGTALFLVGVALSLLPAGHAAANVNLAFPEETPGPPFYARAIAPVPEGVDWVPIVFYRDPNCVPADFNLVSFFDIPRSFGCALTVEGFEIWENGPGQDPAPVEVKSSGLGDVPIWFVGPAELDGALADGIVTIGELSALPSLIMGSAIRFQEVLHPSEAAKHGKLTITAAGSLSDGRTFRLHVSANQDAILRQVRTSFR